MNYFKISLAGDLGSGKSTVAAILSEKYGAEIISVGRLQRAMAQKLGMDTCDFNKYMETHPEYDKNLDDNIKSYESKQGNYIFDSRMAWHFVPSAFSVYMKVDICESARRIIKAGRNDEKYVSVEQAVERLKERRLSESERYKSFYGVDIKDMNNYNLVIDTTNSTPEQVAEIISERYKQKT